MVQTLPSREHEGGAEAPGAMESVPLVEPEADFARALLGERYSIEREIGRGGMGRVYGGVDLRLGRKVAVKALAPGPHGSEQLRRFTIEARAAASLQHPNILDVYDVGVHYGEPYIVSELLEGDTLRGRLSRGELPVGQCVAYAQQLASALAAAHSNGVVHRDLKPENVFVTCDERLKILDFGVAKLLTPDAALASTSSSSGGIVGTAAYISPEQVRGAGVDQRSDVFSFGAILFEMLTGTPVFRRETAVETGYAVLSTEPPALPRSVPADLARVVMRCLDKDPAKRFQDGAALSRELERVVAAHSAPRRWRTVRPLPWIVAGIAVGAFIAVFRPKPGPISPAFASDRQIAVLPFHSIGGGPAQDAFSAGLSEIVTSKLRQVEQFQGSLAVVSANEVIKEHVSGAREAREAFGATHVLGGTVHWSDSTALVALDLVETRNQLVLAARDVELPKEQLAQLQAVLVQKAAEMLDLQLRPETRRALGGDATSAGAAYEFYLQGRGYLQRYDRIENLESAVRVFDQALAIDNSYALAHAGKAEAYLRLSKITRDADVVAKASSSARRAVELNDQLAPVHVTMALVQMIRGKYDEAIQSLQRALALEPRNADALRELANAYDEGGRSAEAEATFRRAIELRQNSWAAYKDLGVFLNQRGRLAEAATQFERVVALTPDNYSGYSNLGGIYLRLGRYDDAERNLRKSLQLRPTAPAYSNLGTLAYMHGRYSDASELYRKAIELNATDDRLWGALADSYRWTPGRAKESLEAFRRALSITDRQIAIDPNHAQLRSRRAIYWSALGEHSRALDEIARALAGSPTNGLILYRAAIVDEQAGRRADAARSLKAAIAAGYSVQEIVNAPPLHALRMDPEIAQLIVDRNAGPAAPRR